MKNAERKRTTLLATLDELNRPLRVRPVRLLGRDWWAIDSDDIWPGMVMDLRRLGFEATAWEEEVLVRESGPMLEPQMEGPAAETGLKPFPVFHPSIRIRKEVPLEQDDRIFRYLDEEDEDEDEDEDEEELEPESLDSDYGVL